MQLVAQRAESVALGVGSRVTVSGLFLACVLTIAVGAMAMLNTLEAMEGDLRTMSSQLDTANKDTAQLNVLMESLPTTDEHMVGILRSVSDTAKEVDKSSASIVAMQRQVATLATMLGTITSSVGSMRTSVESLESGTGTLNDTIGSLNTKIGPLSETQQRMVGHISSMQAGMGKMNGSLAYVVRVMNYMTAPPGGQPFSLRVELDKAALPPVPGVHAKASPVAVFPRNSWPVYTGP